MDTDRITGGWPGDAAELEAVQRRLAGLKPRPWYPPVDGGYTTGACFVCFGRGGSGPGSKGDRGWAGAALLLGARTLASVAVRGEAGSHYIPGKLALREGPLLEAAVRALPDVPDVLFVNATGRDHPRRAGMALHLGAVLGIPTVGVTWRPLMAEGAWPGRKRGDVSPLILYGEEVAAWLRTREGAHPVVVHPGWMTDLDTAVDVVLDACLESATPEPVRQARQAAREARAGRRRTVAAPAVP